MQQVSCCPRTPGGMWRQRRELNPRFRFCRPAPGLLATLPDQGRQELNPLDASFGDLPVTMTSPLQSRHGESNPALSRTKRASQPCGPWRHTPASRGCFHYRLTGQRPAPCGPRGNRTPSSGLQGQRVPVNTISPSEVVESTT